MEKGYRKYKWWLSNIHLAITKFALCELMCYNRLVDEVAK